MHVGTEEINECRIRQGGEPRDEALRRCQISIATSVHEVTYHIFQPGTNCVRANWHWSSQVSCHFECVRTQLKPVVDQCHERRQGPDGRIEADVSKLGDHLRILDWRTISAPVT